MPAVSRASQEFNEKLQGMLDGDMTLVSELGQFKLALQAAIKDAFKTPEVIAMFAKREPAALRGRLAKLSEEAKLGRLPQALFKSQAVEVIVALKRLGETVRQRGDAGGRLGAGSSSARATRAGGASRGARSRASRASQSPAPALSSKIRA